MIHTVRLSTKICARLSELVRLQMDLLYFAANARGSLSEDTLSEFFNAHTTRPTQEAKRISKWLFNSRTSKPLELLNDFAMGTDGQSTVYDLEAIFAEKKRVIKSMRSDVGKLYTKDCNESFSFYLDDETLPVHMRAANDFLRTNRDLKRKGEHFPNWLRALTSFCIYFYDALTNGLPSDLFASGYNITRQTFFTNYMSANPSQFVCAVCDEHVFYTISRKHYLSDIEHYFPKSIYPHLACHPYNLIPICGSCNTIHLQKDPLKGPDNSRKNINQIFLPYRSVNLDKKAAIAVVFSPSSQREIQSTDAINSEVQFYLISKDRSDRDLQEKISAMAITYEIPERWQSKADQIGDRLWHRILECIDLEFQEDDFLDTNYVYAKLSRLLIYFEDDLGKSPWAFVNLWWLANFLVKEVAHVIDGTLDENLSPGLATIRASVSRNTKLRHLRLKKAQEIINVVNDLVNTSSSPNNL